MKIIQIIDNLNTAGGVNSFVYDLCIAMKQAGQKITLIGILGDPVVSKTQAMAVRNAGIPVHCLCMPNKKQAIAKGIPQLRKLVKEIAANEETVCNLHLKLSVLMGCVATIGLKNVKCVETYHSQYSNYWLEYTLMKGRISKYIPCSESAGREMRERFKVPDKKLCVIPNGVNRDMLRKMAGVKDDNQKFSILSVGRLTKQKNYRTTIEAFKGLDNHKAIYQIIGVGEDEEALKSLAENDPSVEFLGAVSREEVINKTTEADLVVMPSLWEGLSVYLMEAMSLGKPLMLSNIESFTDAMKEPPLTENEEWRECKWGYLVRTESPQAFRSAISDYMTHPEKKEFFGQNVLRMSDNYDINRVASQYDELYTSFGGG